MHIKKKQYSNDYFINEKEIWKANLESFGWILLNPEFICVIGTVSNYLGNWGKRVNFSNGVAEIQQKYEREREKVEERKFWISVITLPKFLLPKPANRLGVKCPKETNCGNAIAEIGGKIVAIKKKKCYDYNIFTTFSKQITGN